MKIVGRAWQAHFSKRTKIALGLCASVCLATAGDLAARGLPTQTTTTTTTAAKAVATTVIVTAGKPSELAFKLSTKKVPPGTVTFKVTNLGRLPHTFEICSSPKGGAANTCKGKLTPVLAQGKSATLTVTLAKGQYEYLCTVPGHAAAGMKGDLGAGVTPTAVIPAGTTTSTGPIVVPPATETLMGDPAAGRTVFTSSANPPCTSCHVLAAAGSTAQVGPNLDSLAPGQSQVVTAVTYGLPGGMPAFGGAGGLNGTQINDVAAFVYASTHH